MFKRFKKYLYILVAILLVIFVVWAVKKQGAGNLSTSDVASNFVTSDVTKLGLKTFSHPGYGFSFEYPVDWNATSFAENDGETVLVQKPDQAQGIQIYISMFDEPQTNLSRERILQDIPDIKITNDRQITIAGNINVLSFESENESDQKTQEVWFVHNSFLYQIAAMEGSGEVLDKIINTFKFN
jgi:hypothetical protein